MRAISNIIETPRVFTPEELNIIAQPHEMVNGEPVLLSQEKIDEINSFQSAITSELDATQYIRDRQEAYPKVEDQLDMIYKAIKSGDSNFTEFVQAIDTVKNAYPKSL